MAWFLYIGVGNLFQLVLLQILLGLGDAAGSPSFNAIFAEHLDLGKHIQEYSQWIIIGNFLTAAGTLTGGLVASMFGFRWLFIFMGTLALVSFLGRFDPAKKIDVIGRLPGIG
jgi:MFS family permease